MNKKAIFQMIKIYKDFESIKQALPYIVSLSSPSKMETYGYSTSAQNCSQGSKLHKIKGSVCHNCYARKGRYIFDSCQKCMSKRLDKINNEPYWVDAMIYILKNKKIKNKSLDKFRWHDSGDLQSMEHFRKIIEIARMTPDIKHWLPTKEVKLMKDFVKTGEKLPSNLNVRVSAYMVNGKPVKLKGMTTSVVITKDQMGKCGGFDCPVYSNPNHGKTCGDCDHCYGKIKRRINYLEH
jgi:ribosomal protein L40E